VAVSKLSIYPVPVGLSNLAQQSGGKPHIRMACRHIKSLIDIVGFLAWKCVETHSRHQRETNASSSFAILRSIAHSLRAWEKIDDYINA